MAAPNTNPQEFDLVLTGFRPNQNVNLSGPAKFTLITDGQGSKTNEDVPKGTYTATAKTQGRNQGKLVVPCSKPSRTTTTAARITDVDVSAPTSNPEVDCTVAQNVSFTGKIMGTGTGDVDLSWSGSSGKTSSPTVKFTGPDTAAPSFVVKSSPRAAGATNPVSVSAQLTAGKASDVANFTLKCKA
ncbi:hypothetical protein ACGFYF_07560 [Streptomyces lavendulae]|uniref:hypothetical protein n=1 Tax=Streptomyces lavendulae TaxID=1914 RepID=UPI003722156D